MSKIVDIFPEILWIEDALLREKVEKTFLLGLEIGGLSINSLSEMAYTATYATNIKYRTHVRLVTTIATAMYDSCAKAHEEYVLPNRDYLVAGALLHDVGKLLELELSSDGKTVKSASGKLLRHAFTGVYLAMQNDLPDEIVHIIAVHSHEGVASHPTILGHFVRQADQACERYSDWVLENNNTQG